MNMTTQNRIEIFLYTGLTVLGILGLTWLLHFPWPWLFKLVLAIEALLFIVVNLGEYSGSNSGGSGWLAFAFFIFQGAAALVIIGVRLVIWIGQLFL